MKHIPIKTQKKMMYIPYINILNLFVWLHNSRGLNIPYRGVPQTLSIMFVNAIPLVIMQKIVSEINVNIGNILAYANAYLIPLLISRGLIKLQQQLKDKEENEV